VDQTALPRARHAGHAREHAPRDSRRDVLEVVQGRVADLDRLGPGLPRPAARRPPPQILPRDPRRLQEPLDPPGVHHLPAAAPRAGADVDRVVGAPDHGRVVLDDEDAVPLVTQPPKHPDHGVDILRVESDRRLVEDVHQLHEVAAELARHLHPLALPARERGHGAVERQVPHVDLHHVGEHLLHLPDDRSRDVPLDRPEERAEVGELEIHQLRDRSAVEFHGTRLLVDARPAAGVARRVDEVFLVRVPARRGELLLGLVDVQAFELPDDPLVVLRVRPGAVPLLDRDRLRVQQVAEFVFGEILQLLVHVEEADRDHLAPVPRPHLVVGVDDRPLPDGLLPVKQKVRVDPYPFAEPGAVGTHPRRVVEAEDEGGADERLPAAREEEAEVGVELGRGPHRAAERRPHPLLVDHDRGGDVPYLLHVGLGKLGEARAGERRKRLDELPLRLGVDRVEDQRRLARPRDPGEDHDPVSRDLHRHPLQVVHPRVGDDDPVRHHLPSVDVVCNFLNTKWLCF